MNFLLSRIQEVCPRSYIKGGAVRDKLLGIEPRDIDFLCIGSYDSLVGMFNEHFDWAIPSGKQHGTFMFKSNGEKYECTVVQNLESPSEKSDFTINSMLMDESGRIIDILGGQNDLEMELVRMVSEDALHKDVVRCIRGVRFAFKYGFDIDADTYAVMSQIMPRIILCDNSQYGVSKYRSWNELKKIFELPEAGYAISELNTMGLRMPFQGFIPNPLDSTEKRIAKSLRDLNEAKRKMVYKQFGIAMELRKLVEKEFE